MRGKTHTHQKAAHEAKKKAKREAREKEIKESEEATVKAKKEDEERKAEQQKKAQEKKAEIREYFSSSLAAKKGKVEEEEKCACCEGLASTLPGGAIPEKAGLTRKCRLCKRPMPAKKEHPKVTSYLSKKVKTKAPSTLVLF